MNRERRALVTGASGFVGRRLCERLRAEGWTVRGIAYPGQAANDETIRADVSSPGDIDRVFQWAGDVSHCFHLAAVTFVPDSSRSPALTIDVNTKGTIHVVDAMTKHHPDGRTIYVGSSACYGVPESLPVTELHPFNPKDPYGVSKAAADAYCRYAHRAFGADVIIARPFNHSGPGQSDSFVISNFAKQVAEIEAGKREPVIKVGDLSPRRDFLHVDDVIDAYLLLAERGRAGEAYNICAGKSYSAQDVLDALLALVDVAVEIRADPARMRPVDVPDIVGSHAKLTRDTDWQPRRTFQSLIEDVLNDWRKAIAA